MPRKKGMRPRQPFEIAEDQALAYKLVKQQGKTYRQALEVINARNRHDPTRFEVGDLSLNTVKQDVKNVLSQQNDRRLHQPALINIQAELDDIDREIENVRRWQADVEATGAYVIKEEEDSDGYSKRTRQSSNSEGLKLQHSNMLMRLYEARQALIGVQATLLNQVAAKAIDKVQALGYQNAQEVMAIEEATTPSNLEGL
jgi:hypothetical protein